MAASRGTSPAKCTFEPPARVRPWEHWAPAAVRPERWREREKMRSALRRRLRGGAIGELSMTYLQDESETRPATIGDTGVILASRIRHDLSELAVSSRGGA